MYGNRWSHKKCIMTVHSSIEARSYTLANIHCYKTCNAPITTSLKVYVKQHSLDDLDGHCLEIVCCQNHCPKSLKNY